MLRIRLTPVLLLLLLSGAAAAQLPAVPVPPGNPITHAKVVLGKILFWEEQLSGDDTVACGTCHLPEAGGVDPRQVQSVHPGPDRLFGTADDIRGTSGVVRQDAAGDFARSNDFGIGKQVTGRAAGTTLGAAYHGELFWDGRASSPFVDPETAVPLLPFGGALENQAIGPILNSVEMAGPGRTWNDVRAKLLAVQPLRLATQLPADVATALQLNPTYPDLFRAAFGDAAITAARIAFALASYQRTLIPDQTPFDAFAAGNTNALTPSQQQGLLLFDTNGRCSACHPAPFFSDDTFHNLGLRLAREDLGRGAISGVPIEDGSFKTPSLRNAGLRPRLFHNGSSPPISAPEFLTDQASALNVYMNGGGIDRSNLDGFMVPLNTVGVTTADLVLIFDFVRHGLTDARAQNGLPPFDHPQLRSTALPPLPTVGVALAGASEPTLIDVLPTFGGNHNWKLGMSAGDGPTLAYLAWCHNTLPAPVIASGIPINIGPDVLGMFFVLPGTVGTPGLGTYRLPIPADPYFVNLTVVFQLFALDPVAAPGVSASKAWQFTVR